MGAGGPDLACSPSVEPPGLWQHPTRRDAPDRGRSRARIGKAPVGGTDALRHDRFNGQGAAELKRRWPLDHGVSFLQARTDQAALRVGTTMGLWRLDTASGGLLAFLPAPRYISANVSPLRWVDDDLPVQVRSPPDDSGVDSRRLALKVNSVSVRNLGIDPSSRQIVAAIIAIAAVYDLSIVTEGVENEAQARVLRELQPQGTLCAQGHLYGRPAEVGAMA